MAGFDGVKLRCVCEDILFECFFDIGFFEPTIMNYEPHVHAQYEIHVIENGTYILEELTEDKLYIIKENMCAIISPHNFHNVCLRDENEAAEDIRKYAWRISYKKIKNYENGLKLYEKFEQALKANETKVRLINLPNIAENIKGLHKELKKTGNLQAIYATAYLKQCMTDILYNIVMKDNSSNNNNDDEPDEVRKNEIELFIMKNYDNPKLDLNMLCGYLHLGTRQTIRLFNKYYNMPFRKFLINYRLIRAEKLLQRTNMTLEKLSERVGYETVTGFCTAFKKKNGISPSGFRKQKLNDFKGSDK